MPAYHRQALCVILKTEKRQEGLSGLAIQVLQSNILNFVSFVPPTS
jgi:hypothetical protein